MKFDRTKKQAAGKKGSAAKTAGVGAAVQAKKPAKKISPSRRQASAGRKAAAKSQSADRPKDNGPQLTQEPGKVALESYPSAENRPFSSPLEVLRGRRIVLTVTGGVAAYKAAELARLLTKNGAQVRVLLTKAAECFVTALTFSSLTAQPVASDLWAETSARENVAHVAWAQWAEVMVTAPATANFLAKLTHGLADDLASSVALAFGGPRLAAPAMNTGMYLNPATRTNLELLRQRGYRILESPEGLLACGSVGAGRLAEIREIAWETARLLTGGPLEGRRVVVTGGATREPWDDIRFLSNRSSGRMGACLAAAAWLMGAEVTFIAGPAAIVPEVSPEGLKIVRIQTCEELLAAVRKAIEGAWALVMNAAPADFKPAEKVAGKIRKSKDKLPQLALTRTPDILKTLASELGRTIRVGFAAEDGDNPVQRARQKLKDKNLDYICANRAGGAGDTFESPDIELTFLSAAGREIPIGPVPKFQAAWTLWELLAAGTKRS
ncbi:MAG: bifunctional phosphopantothenoylcysteine decarboxylase/phosphopantothenate--cysteine ligase CoaBC [Deltaproteobacteria bacterium]|nr:bifunctional phosphopantothenoylcysteine decarboxylase/phosphopantothenate--cysteine ligase CoaBC [Deltaproteobacteria bacterium]